MTSQRRSPTRVLRVIARMNVGGPAIHATLLHTKLDRARFDSTLVTGREGATEGSYLELHGLQLPGLVVLPNLGREVRGIADVRTLAQLVRLMRRVRPDVVHTHTAKAGTLGRLAAWISRVPVVVHTYHGHVLRGYFSVAATRVFLGIERALARTSDALVAVTPQVRDDLLVLGVGRAEQFHVVPLGFDLDRFRQSERLRGQLRAELALPPDSELVGIVARLVPIKAHEVFLDAAARVASARPRVKFLIVGDGERRGELEAIAARLALSDKVRFLGWRADLDRLYADMDVVVLTSRNEGSPVALIEALASARPVVSTRVGGVPDVVLDGETGVLTEPDDPAAVASAIQRLLAAPAVARSMGLRARETVLRKYSVSRLCDDVERLYDGLLRAKGLAW